jgi:glutathione S-transferase
LALYQGGVVFQGGAMEIVLHSAPGSNSSDRVEWVLRYKEIPYEKIYSQDIRLNPYGYVPLLVVNGSAIAESMAIAEFLEEIFPQKPLFPDKALDRALVREICEYVNSTIHQPQNRTVLKFFIPDIADDARKQLRGEWIFHCLNKLESRLWKHSAFAVGDTFTLADIFVASIYRKAISHGAGSLPVYDSYIMGLSGITGYDA